MHTHPHPSTPSQKKVPPNHNQPNKGHKHPYPPTTSQEMVIPTIKVIDLQGHVRQTRDSIRDRAGWLVGKILFSQFLGSTFWKEEIFFEKKQSLFQYSLIYSQKNL